MTEANLQNNPLLATDGLPRFGEIQPEHIVPGVRHILSETDQKIQLLERQLSDGTAPTWETVVRPLEELEVPFEYGWGPIRHLLGVLNSAELRKAYEEVLPEVVAFSLRVKQSEPIYGALKTIREGNEWERLTPTRQRIIEKRLLDAELAGIGLQGPDRERFNEIARELSQLSTDFSNHVLDATKAWSLVVTEKEDAEGLPPSLLQLAAQSYNETKSEDVPSATADDGPWRITLDPPSFVPFMQHCRNRDLREEAYRAYITRASRGEFDNTSIIPRILVLRKEKAALLGYRTYAEVSLAEKMAESVDAVEEMFDRLRSASWDSAVQDMEDLRQLASDSGATEPLMNWDVAFWAERLREKRFDFTDEQLRPYFPLQRVLEGLFGLVDRLFGMKVTPADGEAPVWHKDVRFFHVHDESGEHVASFYLDPYSRPENKRGGAWMDECLTRRRIDGRLQVPVAHLVCNSTPPVGDRPALMTFREVETLFHEFGHGLQHMLTRVDESDAAGINGVEWDAVELPSQFMENWCYHKPTLLGMTAHHETGEPLPEELFEKLRQARTYRAGSGMLRQLQFGMTDMELHERYDPETSGETPFDVHRRVNETTSVLPMLPEDRTLCGFQHIFAGAYAAGYYSYKWAEVLSADAFSAFEEAGLDDERAIAETGRRFRETILASGGSRHPMEVFQEFRGREPTPEALLRHSGLISQEQADGP